MMVERDGRRATRLLHYVILDSVTADRDVGPPGVGAAEESADVMKVGVMQVTRGYIRDTAELNLDHQGILRQLPRRRRGAPQRSTPHWERWVRSAPDLR